MSFFGKKRSKRGCPKEQGGLLVNVRRETDQVGVAGAQVSIDGPTPGQKPTSQVGAAEFKGLEFGTYQVKIELSAKEKDDHVLLDYPSSASVSSPDQLAVVIAYVRPPGALRAKVVWHRPTREGGFTVIALDGAKVHVGRAGVTDQSTGKDPSPWAEFPRVRSGDYKVTAPSLGAHAKHFHVPAPVDAAVEPGKRAEVTLQAVPRVSLRLVLTGRDGKPVANKKWALQGPANVSGTTGANGLIEAEDLPLQRGAGLLRVEMDKPKAAPAAPSPAPAPADPNAPPPYPPPIDAAAFKDPGAGPPATDPENDHALWTLKIGIRDDYDDDDGARARLHNLGFGCTRGSDEATTRRAVEAYQRLQLKQDKPSGKLADVKGQVRDFHDNP